MRKIIIALLCCATILCGVCIYPAYANDETIYYRITTENCILYKNLDDVQSISSQYFVLPSTYFVRLISEEENYLKVSYDGITGYVDKNAVTRVYSSPVTPYPTQLKVTSNGIANILIRTEPTNNSTCIGVIPYDEQNIKYYGSITGEAVYTALGDIWYYCKYTDSASNEFSGYIYSPLTTGIGIIPINEEVVATEPIKPEGGDILAPELLSSGNLAIIIALAIPATILLILLFRPGLKRKNDKIKVVRLPEKANQGDELNF